MSSTVTRLVSNTNDRALSNEQMVFSGLSQSHAESPRHEAPDKEIGFVLHRSERDQNESRDLLQVERTQSITVDDFADGELEQILTESNASLGRSKLFSSVERNKQAQRLKKLRDLGKKKQAKLVEENRKRQAMYFGQTQYKFLQTTNQHGALLDDYGDEDYGDEEGEVVAKSLWQKTQESAALFNCFKWCRRRQAEQVEDDFDVTLIEDQSIDMDDSAVAQPIIENKGPMKKRVVPNKFQDKWLVYLLNNLNKANDLEWVNVLLSKIENTQEEFNAGKFRGAVF